MLFAVHLGTVAGGGVVCIRLEPPPELQAGFPEDARPCVRFCYRINLDTPSHAQALHKRYDAKPRAVEEATKDSLRSRMQAHLEKLRDGKRPDDAPIAHPGVTQGGPLGLPEAITPAGVTFEGRQMNLARANVGDAIRLVRRPENAFDPNAVEVLTVDGASLGWVPKTQAKLIAAHLDAGTAIHGKILSVTGNLDAGYNLGASVSLITENFGGGTKQGSRKAAP